ncbi:hypothetical protein [Ruegeria atlantica]|uniref:Uncharacterized protein n=1 Tax=Ruegeria atlantica TaxID=81569 RepID=A0A0P1F421_9RHOB|nr:hypothetical protein [Ruegeria atlantica]CUH49781.1 hypothetical protein RUA4292_03978 [Ruegeria atlantica]
MSLSFVTRNIHAYLDYPVAFALMGLPFLLGLGQSNPMALWLTVLTDHHLGIWRVLPYNFHLAVDLLVGVVFLAAPSLFGFSGLDAIFYWLNGAAVVAVISLSAPEQGVTV